MNVYADSSFFVSPYVRDSHTKEFLKLVESKPSVWLTPFHEAEVAHAIALHVFTKKLKQNTAAEAWSEFQKDIRAGTWIKVEFPATVWSTCIGLARNYGATLGIRTLDSLHVACALGLRSDRFWTFDERQAKLARAVGLDTQF